MLDLSQIARIAAEIRADLGEDDDESAVADTLDGATDAMDLMDWLIRKQQEAATLAAAIKAQKAALATREARLDMRADAMKAKMGDLLDAMTLTKVERPGATVSRRPGSISVRIVDEAAIPSQLCTVKTITAPDKAAIRAQIEAGENVPGAELVRGPNTTALRVA